METVEARSESVTFTAQLDFDEMTWSALGDEEPEGEFPFIAELEGKRYELYSDGTFDEVELTA